jgi:hypothetical protein
MPSTIGGYTYWRGESPEFQFEIGYPVDICRLQLRYRCVAAIGTSQRSPRFIDKSMGFVPALFHDYATGSSRGVRS